MERQAIIQMQEAVNQNDARAFNALRSVFQFPLTLPPLSVVCPPFSVPYRQFSDR